MKKVYILRHADKNKETGELTEQGRKRAKELKKHLGTFNIIIGSDRPRVTETAELLTGKFPTIDERTGFVYTSKEQNEKLSKLAKIHPLSHAGVIFENPEFKDLALIIGQNLIALIKETLTRLPENGKALIVSQDGVMVSAENILTNKPYKKLATSFKPLDGYIINEHLQIEQIG